MEDFSLLDEYLASGDQAGFRALVERFLPMVYNVARREFSGHETHTEDIAQSVFVLLAQKGLNISRRKPLAAWLYQTTCYCCANLKRMEARRKRHETEAAMEASKVSTAPTSDVDVKDLLDEALAQLGPKERDLLMIRYSPSGDGSAAQIAAALGVSHAAAEKRVERAIGKLRAYFARRKQLAHASTIPAMLALQSLTAPQHLSTVITNAATNAGPASPGALALVAAFATSSTLYLKAAALILIASATLTAIGLTTWHFIGATPVSAASAPASALPDADALPLFIPGPLAQRTYFANMSRNVFPQGILTSTKENTIPDGWSASPDPFALGVAAYDPKRKLIRITSPDFGKKIELRTSLPLKPEWHTIMVRATLANRQLELGDPDKAAAGVFFCPVDKNNNQLGPAAYIFFKVGQGDWFKVRMTTLTVPPEAVSLNVLIRFSDGKGFLGIQRIGVIPFDEKLDPDPAQVVAMQTAVKNNDVQAITDLATADKRLLEGRNMNWDCGSPLIGAAWTGHLEAVQTLLNLGADIHALDDNGDDNGGYWTACTTAAYQGRPDCFKFLFDRAPEKTEYLIPIIRDGMHLHTNPAANYQDCLDYIAQKFPATTTQPLPTP